MIQDARQIIVFGYGPYGEEIAKSLRTIYNEIIIVDQYQRHLDKAAKDGFSHLIQIDVRDEDSFASLPIIDGSVAFCAFEEEGFNTYLTISLRSEYEDLTIVAIGETKESTHKLSMAGANKVIIVEETGANVIYNSLINPNVANLFDQILYEDHDLSIAEIIISENSPMAGHYLKDILMQNEYNIIIVGIVDLEYSKKFVFANSGYNHKVDTGDALVVIGHEQEILRCKEEL